MISPADTTLLEAGMNRLSDMGNNVAGFAISSSLVLVFACLKDLGHWVKSQNRAFQIGIVAGNIIYIGSVWCLHSRELAVLRVISPPEMEQLRAISTELAVARTVGIAFFAVIAIGAVIGAKRGAP